MKKPQWNSIDVSGCINNNQTDITYFFNTISPWLNYLTFNNEELKHDIFLKLLSKLPQFQPSKGKLHNFLWTVATNHYKESKIIKKRKILFHDVDISNIDIIEEEHMFFSNNLELLDKLPQNDHLFLINHIIKQKKDQSIQDRKRFQLIKKQLLKLKN
jgi:DNA-directed RNA polymerase specialized sigma24 family protein